ncbi:MAG: iron complex outermembrane receptor protein [Arenicella sp.]|jgi:iron complex outermembrane receptor protein
MLNFLFGFISLLNFTVTGEVQDDLGESLPGVTISQKGTTNQTITDINGKFSLEIEGNEPVVLVFNFGGSPIEKQVYPSNPYLGKIRIDSNPNSYSLDELVIESIRMGEKVPITQKTWQKEQIEEIYFGQEIPMLLSRMPSVNVSADGGNYSGYTYLRLRGIDQTRINVTLNGVPLSEPEDQGIYFSNFTDFANSIQSVQVQRGVGTSTFGTASYAGSINFESVDLEDSKPSAELQTGYGSFQSYRVSAEAKTGLLPNKFALYTRASLSGSGGYRNHSGNESNSIFMSGGYFGDRDIVKLTAFSGRIQSEMAYLATQVSDIEIDPKTNYLTEDEHDDFRQDFIQLQYTHEFNSNWVITNSFYYIHIDGNYDIGYPLGNQYILENLALKSDLFGLQSTVVYSRNSFKFYGGGNANTFKRNHFYSAKPNTSTALYSNNGIKREASAFAKFQYEIRKFNFFVYLQGRVAEFDYEPDQNANITVNKARWSFFNPKAGFSYQITPKLQSYVSIGRTSREPTRTDIFGAYDDLNSTNISEIGGLEAVKPETVTDLEVGYKWKSTKIYANLNAFFMEFRNEITPIGALNQFGIPLRKNVAESYRRGLELDLGWEITENLTFSHNSAFVKAQIKEHTSEIDGQTYRNVRPLLTPKWTINNSLQYKWKVLDFGLDGRYVSESFLDSNDDDRFVTPNYFLLDFRTTINFAKKHQFTIFVNNIFDETYFTNG